MKRQYLGCAGRVANGINTVHLSYVREKTGHALIGARQWIPREHLADPVKSLLMGLPLDLEFRTKGQLAIDIFTSAYADGLGFDFACGDEVYGNCTQLREFFETRSQAYVLRVPSNFMITLAAGTRMTCAEVVTALLKHKRRWEVRSAGSGSKGERWYAWAWIATASPRHHLLVRRHLKTGDLAFCYCWVPDGQLTAKARLIRAAGLRWPVEEDFEFSKDCFGLDQCQARLYTAIPARRSPVRASLLRADDASGHARNPYLAVFFVGADLGDDGFRDRLPCWFVDLLKRRNCERDMLADHLPILRGRSRHEFDVDVPPLTCRLQVRGTVQATLTLPWCLRL